LNHGGRRRKKEGKKEKKVYTSDLLIAISNTTLNSKGAIVSRCLKPLFTLNLDDKCLPVLTSAHISLFKILHNLTNFSWEA